MNRLFILFCILALAVCCSPGSPEEIPVTSDGGTTGGTGSTSASGTASGEATGGSGSGGATAGSGSGGATGGTGIVGGEENCGLDEPNLDALPIGAPCSTHEECSTGYCYDEALFNEDAPDHGGIEGNGDKLVHRFCTVSCVGCGKNKTCSDWPKAPNNGNNKCYPFPSYYINFFSLEYKSLCLVGCYTDTDCMGLGQFSKCAPMAFGKDNSYGSPDVCQPPEYVRLGEDAFSN
jgi:hypothetical protein